MPKKAFKVMHGDVITVRLADGSESALFEVTGNSCRVTVDTTEGMVIEAGGEVYGHTPLRDPEPEAPPLDSGTSGDQITNGPGSDAGVGSDATTESHEGSEAPQE